MTGARAKALMVLGTGSGVGKSFVAAGLCRLLSNAGVKVAPFKAQNMSNNSFVTCEGLEMARAQVVQAECARVEPCIDMNPILLKPEADNGSQVVIQGKSIGRLTAREYYGMKEKIQIAIRESYERLSQEFDFLVIEGAGSPAEINLRESDLVNFQTAEMANADCLLVGDIDRGGVFAWLFGTLALLEEDERARIAGLIINKFRGDPTLLEPGLGMLENLCGKKVLGVLPYETDLWIEEEDSLNWVRGEALPSSGSLDIAVLFLPRISNATDFQILEKEPGVHLRLIRRIEEFGSPDLLILPGTKSTIADLEYLRTKGFAKKIQDYAEKEGRILGICGGFQMLGEAIEDPEGVESRNHRVAGLGLLGVRTRFAPEKILRRVHGRAHGKIFSREMEGRLLGYEIHMGQTEFSKDTSRVFEVAPFDSNGPWQPEGAVNSTGRILGTYLHGLFDEASFRGAFLEALCQSTGKTRSDQKGEPVPSSFQVREINYERLARLLQDHLDLGFLNPWLKLSSHLA